MIIMVEKTDSVHDSTIILVLLTPGKVVASRHGQHRLAHIALFSIHLTPRIGDNVSRRQNGVTRYEGIS
ncbi:hypothetical protein H0484_07460 [Pusillimonas sp. CC-YST705]|uniref:Uncharacterized protein n=1 Tax=Mesopusillimonas faecipullorum TaxID=2755040 RepID=A0ABS8CC32_9BURK|nr:hypothetical protein [Mesopusillimonas faecipullorum]MCB5363584.1 hypothetical protein [Mesopusillimonas faecipullorum]